MGYPRWTAEDDTKLVRATRRMLARNGGVLPKQYAPEWKKMHRKLNLDHPVNQFYIHYNWICWAHKWGLDPRHPVTHASEIAHRELLGCDFGPVKSWASESEAEAPPPPKRTRVKRESAPEAEEIKLHITSKVKKEIDESAETKKKKRMAEPDMETENRPKRARATVAAALKPKGAVSIRKRS